MHEEVIKLPETEEAVVDEEVLLPSWSKVHTGTEEARGEGRGERKRGEESNERRIEKGRKEGGREEGREFANRKKLKFWLTFL